MDLSPLIIDYFYKKNRVNNIKEFVIGWLAYINKKNSIKLQCRVQELYSKLGEKFNLEEYTKIFNKYSNSSISVFPYLKDNNMGEKYKLSNFILGVTDMSNDDVVERAKEFSNDYLKLAFVDTEQQIKFISDNQEYISDVANFTAFSIMDIFKDIPDNIETAKEASLYSLENDPFEKQRNSRKNKIIESVNIGTPIVLGALTFYTGPLGDALLTASAPAISKLINPQIDVNKTIEIQQKIKQLKTKGVGIVNE
jgi:hypothetical protein